MVRVKEARENGWTAAECEAAAAALGSFAADTIRMGSYCDKRGGDDPVGRSMDAAAAQIVRWAATDAASYARLALAEYDRIADALMPARCTRCEGDGFEPDYVNTCKRCHGNGKEPKEEAPIVTVCAWCPREQREAAERAAAEHGAKVSHGICDPCRVRWEAVTPDPRD